VYYWFSLEQYFGRLLTGSLPGDNGVMAAKGALCNTAGHYLIILRINMPLAGESY